MQGGEPLSVRSSAKRVKRSTGEETADRKIAPPRHNLPGFGLGRGPRAWRDWKRRRRVHEYVCAEPGYAFGIEGT